MFQRLRRHLSYANIAATLAVVFAMSGGAYALSGGGHAPVASASGARGLAAKAHKHTQARKVLRGPAGPKGATGAAGAQGATGGQGPAGPAGAQGAKGETGTAGTKGETGAPGATGKAGKNGENGENVQVTSLVKGSEPEPSKECKNLGGAKFSNATGTAFACDGETGSGSGGSGGTLGPGETETGAWGGTTTLLTSGYYINFSGLTFQRPVPGITGTGVVRQGGSSTENCPGSAAEPTAAPGSICIYVAAEENISIVNVLDEYPGGGVLELAGQENKGEGVAFGTWAVTG